MLLAGKLLIGAAVALYMAKRHAEATAAAANPNTSGNLTPNALTQAARDTLALQTAPTVQGPPQVLPVVAPSAPSDAAHALGLVSYPMPVGVGAPALHSYVAPHSRGFGR